jgi:TATA-box binding protein (TBP) (component of TFIID and TFIIIB)
MFFDTSNEYEGLDLKVLKFINLINNKENEKIPEPTYFTISTQSAMSTFSNAKMLDLSKIVVFISKNIINNIILKKDPDYLIRGIVVDNIILRFDESHLKKYKNPMIKYMNVNINPDDMNAVLLMLGNIQILEQNSLKKHGRHKNKKENENFYNSCSIIVKGASNIKCVNIKLFNNGEITLTGSKNEMDGYHACNVLLNEMKKEKTIFMEMNEQEITQCTVINYRITMINSDFNTNFKIDLIKLLDILNKNESELFTKFNPEKYRGLIIGFFWNLNKDVQNGKCNCTEKCNGKGTGSGNGQCKKITISIFKSGSVIITGARLLKQIEDTYYEINNIFKKYYHDIIKMSLLDFINDLEEKDEDIIMEPIVKKITVKKEKIKKCEKEGVTKKIKIKEIKQIKDNEVYDKDNKVYDKDNEVYDKNEYYNVECNV